jgi:hypothetical protein
MITSFFDLIKISQFKLFQKKKYKNDGCARKHYVKFKKDILVSESNRIWLADTNLNLQIIKNGGCAGETFILNFSSFLLPDELDPS